MELLNKHFWFKDYDSPTGSTRNRKSKKESKRISPNEHSETKKAMHEKLANTATLSR